MTLAMVKRFGLVYVDQADPPGPPSPDWNGRQIPLHATSSGKVFLAWMPEDERAAVLPAVLERYTPHTIVDRAELDRELERVRRDGYATCLGEYDYSNGVSAAVFDATPPADRDRQHLGPEPARHPHAAARARARRPARRPRDVAAAGMSAPRAVGLLGGGVIGGGWAARFLLGGIDVRLYDPDPEAERKLGEMLENARRALTRLSAVPLPPEGALDVVATPAEAARGRPARAGERARAARAQAGAARRGLRRGRARTC